MCARLFNQPSQRTDKHRPPLIARPRWRRPDDRVASKLVPTLARCWDTKWMGEVPSKPSSRY